MTTIQAYELHDVSCLDRSEQRKRTQFEYPLPANYNQDINFEPIIDSKSSFLPQQKKFPEIPAKMIESNIQQNRWKNGLIILYYVSKFIKQLKTRNSNTRFKVLNKEILNIIDDLASDPTIFLKQILYLQIITENFKKFINHLPTIDPHSIYKLSWDILVLILLIINPFYIALKVCLNIYQNFTPSEKIEHAFFFSTFTPLVFFLDIIINSLTAYYDKEHIQYDKMSIMLNYLKVGFLEDFLLITPYFISLIFGQYFQLLLLFRLIKISKQVDKIIDVINPSEQTGSIVELIQTVFLMVIICHICACFWNLLGQWQYDRGNASWIEEKNLQDDQWPQKYIYSLYFICITTLTIGYGDMLPTTTLERVCVILLALVICGVLAYAITKIGNIVERLTEKEKKIRLKMMIINNYLKERNINKQLHHQVKKYFENYFQIVSQQNEECEQLMQQLTPQLQKRIYIDIYFKILSNSRLFSNLLSKQSIQNLCKFVKEKQYAPNTYITNSNDNNRNLYFIESGIVEFICKLNNKEISLGKIMKGNFIGEREFITQQNPYYDLKTQTFCKIYQINYEDFLQIIQDNLLEREKFMVLKDDVTFLEKSSNFGSLCKICKWTHQFTKCPFVFMNSNLNQIRNNFIRQQLQIRKHFQRRPNKSKIEFNYLRDNALAIMLNQNLTSELDLDPLVLKQFGLSFNENSPKMQKNDSIKQINQVDTNPTTRARETSLIPLQQQQNLDSGNSGNSGNEKQQVPSQLSSSFSQTSAIKAFEFMQQRQSNTKSFTIEQFLNQNSKSLSRQTFQFLQEKVPTLQLDKYAQQPVSALKQQLFQNIESLKGVEDDNIASSNKVIFQNSSYDVQQLSQLPPIIVEEQLNFDKLYNSSVYHPSFNIENIIQSFKKITKLGQIMKSRSQRGLFKKSFKTKREGSNQTKKTDKQDSKL